MFAECRLPAADAQIRRPAPSKPPFLMESLTREGLNTASIDDQTSHGLRERYHDAL